MRLTDEREQFIRETGGGFADIAVLLGEVDALRGALAKAQETNRTVYALRARAEAAEAERDRWKSAAMFHAEWAEDAEARIAATIAEMDKLRPSKKMDPAEDEWCAGFDRGWNECLKRVLKFRAALVEPVGPKEDA